LGRKDGKESAGSELVADVVADLVEYSYRMTAPKRLSAQRNQYQLASSHLSGGLSQ